MRILVLCNGNSCRSQLAEAYLQTFLGDKAEVCSAGIAPKGVHPLTIHVLAEDGIDRSTKTSKNVSVFQDDRIDIILTVCDAAHERCPLFAGTGKKIHHSFRDPDRSGLDPEGLLQEFRTLREEIKTFCKDFADQIKQTNYREIVE